VIRLAQPDADQRLKWRADTRDLFVGRLLDATAAAPRPDAVIWPETALPYWLAEAGPILERAAAPGAPVLLGVQRWDGAPVQTYDKHHLVPFGEYVPLAPLLGRLGLEGLAGGGLAGFAPGPGPGTLHLPGIGPAAILICYEAVFPAMLRTPGRPRLIVQVTNDAWFGRNAGPAQHLAQARLRAAETGLPLARSANTGITAMIDAGGRVTARLPPRVPGHLDARLPPALPPTPYVRAGDTPVLALAAVLLAAGWAASRRGVAIDRSARGG
jgi:apolipoprotein N-acyltransferase